MPGPFDDGRNPLIIPEPETGRRGCPKCGRSNYNARRIEGAVTFSCKQPECGMVWYGGLPQMPQDPRVPTPPINPADLPRIDFVRDSKGGFQEVRRRPNPTPEFKKGAPIGPGEDI
jgi:hypothetical protein